MICWCISIYITKSFTKIHMRHVVDKLHVVLYNEKELGRAATHWSWSRRAQYKRICAIKEKQKYTRRDDIPLWHQGSKIDASTSRAGARLIFMNLTNRTISTNLSAMMADKKLTDKDLAEKTNLSESTVSSFTAGKGGYVSDLCRIADVLEVQPASLMCDNASNLQLVLRVLLAKQSAPNKLTIGAKIATQRRLMNKTQADLGHDVGLPRQEVSRLEHGYRDPKCDLLAAIAEALQCPTSLFLPFRDVGEGDVILATQTVIQMMKTS